MAITDSRGVASPVELVVTCGSWQEAQRIVDTLLERQLIACAEFLNVTSKFSWKGEQQNAEEIKLIMLSLDHLFYAVESEVKKLHSYDTFVLQAIPVVHINKQAQHWIDHTIRQDLEG